MPTGLTQATRVSEKPGLAPGKFDFHDTMSYTTEI